MPSYKNVDHLCILVHGLWGNPSHLANLRQVLEDAQPDNVHIHIAENNTNYWTYDGIEVGAERVAHEIEGLIAKLSGRGANLTKISVIGYSLGGLIARYTIGLLYKDGVFERLKPINFTTFASPWLGTRNPQGGLLGAVFNTIGSRTLSSTGRQMFTVDKFRDTGRPLLSVLADPGSIFMRALKMFKNKSLYANTLNDRSVPYYTASFSRTDPFVDMDAINLHYLPGQDEKVILDPKNPVSYRPQDTSISGYQRLRLRAIKVSSKLPMYAMIAVFLPIAATVMLVNGTYQSYKSSGRIRSHESGQALVDSKKYRIPLLEQTQAIQDRAIGQIMNTEPVTTSHDGAKTTGSDPMDFPAIALTADQLQMIRDLEEAGITRYRAHIHKARHTHAAIVVRYQHPDFTEGVAVVNHWAQNFES